jgi:MFS family permease
MRRYTSADEERIWTSALVREWAQSGLLTAAQGAAIDATLRTDLRRTNSALRAVLFIFASIVLLASMFFYLELFSVWRSTQVARAAIAVGLVAVFAAEWLVAQFRLYRFGVEEACAVWSIVLLAFGAGFLAGSDSGRGDWPAVVALLTGTIVSAAVYLRFGFLYAAVGAVVCAGLAPLFLGVSYVDRRLAAALVLFAIFLVTRRLRQRHVDFVAEEYGVIESTAWLGLYALLNLHLGSRGLFYPYDLRFPPTFYWGTYTAIWLLPAVGLYFGLRERHRHFIWVNLVMALATLSTNKPYLGWPQHTWDPILLGLMLTGAAIIIRRWLASGPDGRRYGFVPLSVLSADRRSLAMLGTVAGAAEPFAARRHEAPRPGPSIDTSGGRSGGGGGGAGF